MKVFYIIMVVLVVVAAVVFALQNSAVITISYFSWSISGSLSLLLIITLAVGFLLGVLLMVPSVFRRSRIASGLKRQVSVLEKEKSKVGQASTEMAVPTDLGTGPDNVGAKR